MVPGVVRQPVKKVGKFWDFGDFSVLEATARLRSIHHGPYDLPRPHTVCGGTSGAMAAHNWCSLGQNQAETLDFSLTGLVLETIGKSMILSILRPCPDHDGGFPGRKQTLYSISELIRMFLKD